MRFLPAKADSKTIIEVDIPGMPEINPELDRRNLGPEAGSEFYESAQVKPEAVRRGWVTPAEKAGHADKAAEIIGQLKVEKPTEISDTGLSPQEHEKLLKDPTAWVNEAIGDKNLDGYEAVNALSEIMDEEK